MEHFLLVSEVLEAVVCFLRVCPSYLSKGRVQKVAQRLELDHELTPTRPPRLYSPDSEKYTAKLL